MKKLDKKQVPQFLALCVLSAGVFGYFVVRLVTPSPAAAGTRPRQEAAKPQSAGPSSAAKKPGIVADTATADAAPVPAPTAGMRDPFVVGYVDPKMIPAAPLHTPAASVLPKSSKTGATQVASIQELGPAPVTAPFVPGLPLGLKGFSSPPPSPAPGLPSAPPAPSLPFAPAAPSWTVTGVLQNDTQQVAILRNGEARRIVRTGDYVDSQFRVVNVTRTSVALRHGATVYHLTLGGPKTAPAPPKAMPVPGLTTPLFPAMIAPTAKPQNAAPRPAQQSAGLKGSLTAITQSGLTLAQSFLAAVQAGPAQRAPLPAAQVRTTNTLNGTQVAETLPAHTHSTH